MIYLVHISFVPLLPITSVGLGVVTGRKYDGFYLYSMTIILSHGRSGFVQYTLVVLEIEKTYGS